MTTQDLYTKLSKGEITEQKFLYEVRRDSRLPWITSHNSFKDTITILKNKGIISEKQTKESTGKQEVEIIAKTIDMVNPYEYSKGMNFELDLVYNAVGNADLTEEEVLKAQKKVLKNLTNNPQYYSQKMSSKMEGESEYEVEVNAKSIEDLKKKQGKIIREHGEEYDRVADVNADSSPLEEKFSEFKTYDEVIGGIIVRLGALEDFIAIAYPEKLKDVQTIKDLIDSLDEYVAYGGEDGLDEHGQYADRVADVNADSSPLNENEIEEMGRKRDAIYEKYAEKYGVDVNELKDRVEAIKLEKEAIEVDNEDAAIAIQKKSPDADVRVVKK